MPHKRTLVSKKRRLQKKRKGSGKKGKSLVPRDRTTVSSASQSWNILPRKFTRILPYSDTRSYSTGTGGIVGTIGNYLLNDIYDPYSTGTGKSAYGHDQLKTWYSRYLVTFIRLEISFSTVGGTAEIGVHWKIDTPDSYLSIAGLTYDQACTLPSVGSKLQGSSGNDRIGKVIMNICPWKIIGVTRAQWFDEFLTYGGMFGARASTGPSLQIGISSPNGTAGETSLVQVKMYFTTECSEPNQMAFSN